MVEVVAALIERGERFLICQRPAHKARGLLWEFVGGKVEPHETPEQALARECREELGVELRAGAKFFEVTHAYPDIEVHLTLFRAAIESGEPKKLEHNDICPRRSTAFPSARRTWTSSPGSAAACPRAQGFRRPSACSCARWARRTFPSCAPFCRTRR